MEKGADNDAGAVIGMGAINSGPSGRSMLSPTQRVRLMIAIRIYWSRVMWIRTCIYLLTLEPSLCGADEGPGLVRVLFMKDIRGEAVRCVRVCVSST